MNVIRIVATGGAEGSRIITNDMLAQKVDTSDEWIYPRTGIHERRICAEGENCVLLAIKAAENALENAGRASVQTDPKSTSGQGISPEEIGCVVVATMSADYATPSTACLVQQALHLPEQIPVLDVNAACSGFIYALEIARGFLASSGHRYGLVIGSEQLSRLINWQDRSTCILFADGAGAAVVESIPEGGGIYGSFLAARGGREILAEGAGYTPSYIRMDGKAVFRFAVEVMPKAAKGALSDAGISMDDIDHIICHQANSRIIDHFIKKSGQNPDKFFKNIEHCGNTSAASIPIALNEMNQKGLLHQGDRLLMIGFGAGLTYGACALEYGERSDKNEKIK